LTTMADYRFTAHFWGLFSTIEFPYPSTTVVNFELICSIACRIVRAASEILMSRHAHQVWLSLYKAALLELDLRKMPGRIVEARLALQERIQELEGANGHYQEKLEIQYAVRNLHAAERMK